MSSSAAANFRTKGIEIINNAAALDHAGDHANALQLYLQGIEYLFQSIKFEKNESFKSGLRTKVTQYLDRVEELKQMKAKPQPVPQGGGSNKPKGNSKKGSGKSNDDKGSDKEEDDSESGKLKGALESAIVREKPNVKWDDVAGLELAKEALKEAVIMPLKFPHLFTGKRTPWKGILLYGPPGTGKSYLAKAVATEVDSTFFSISSSDLVSKWQGESERLIKQLFELARESKPSIIFIDEIDSLCSARSDNESEASRRIKTEILVQMQGVGNVSDGILILGATNIPWNIDSAVRRRFEKRIYIPLPEAPARTQMFKIHLGNTPHNLVERDFEELGQMTEKFSGSDVNIIVRDALYQPVRSLQSSTHFKKATAPSDSEEAFVWIPCTPSESEAVEMKLMDIEPTRVGVPPVGRGHFEKSLSKMKPSVSEEDIVEHIKWTQEFGSAD
ncbi:hypothetical protein GEMRC1_000213 [Eukaryota sp. GEM-RC1]